MKRLCKDVDITDLAFIRQAIDDCLRKKKKSRRDIAALLAEHDYDRDSIAHMLQQELRARYLILKPIWYSTRIDSSSQKPRTIGIQDIKQQMYDYIAVNALEPVFRSIGEYQVASIPDRGNDYGIKAIAKWVKDDEVRYVGKMDIRKFYESVDRELLLKKLRRHVKNDALLWLVETLISTFDHGLSIGSYLSQFLANWYLSELYHDVSERMYRVRRKRNGETVRVNLVKHVLFQMDDLFVFGTNAKDVNRAVHMMIDKLNEMHLTVKPNWRVYKLSDSVFVDVLGVRIYRDRVTIRQHVFLKVRRTFKKARRAMYPALAKRIISYWGILKHTSSFVLRKRLKAPRYVKEARRLISRESTIRREAETA